MFSLIVPSIRGLIPARILNSATAVPLLLCIILSAGPALAVDGNRPLSTNSPAPATNGMAKMFEASHHPGSVSDNTACMLPFWVLEGHMEDRDSRNSVLGSGTRSMALTGPDDTEESEVMFPSQASGDSSLESRTDSPWGFLSEDSVVPLFKGGAAAVRSFTASVSAIHTTSVSLESSLWNSVRSFGVASVLNHLESLLSDKLFLLRTEIMGNPAQVRLGFQKPTIPGGVRRASTPENVGNRYAPDWDGAPDSDTNRFSCVSLSFRVTF